MNSQKSDNLKLNTKKINSSCASTETSDSISSQNCTYDQTCNLDTGVLVQNKTVSNKELNENQFKFSLLKSNNFLPNSHELVIYLDNNSMNETDLNPNFKQLLEKINANIELDTAKKKLELEEKNIYISMLEQEKAYKIELNKHELTQKTFELKRRSSELDYINKLRDLLIEAINNNDLSKISYISICLNNQSTIPINSQADLKATQFNFLNSSGSLLNMNQLNEKVNSELKVDDLSRLINANGFNEQVACFSEDFVKTNMSNENDENMDELEENEEENEEETEQKNFNENIEENSNNSASNNNSITNRGINTSFMSNKNRINFLRCVIRHIICSSPKLEDYSNNCKVKILFKGKCYNEDVCRFKEAHTHYLIDVTECNRHISLYFQSIKFGLKFYKTYQIKSQAEYENVIDAFKMKRI